MRYAFAFTFLSAAPILQEKEIVHFTSNPAKLSVCVCAAAAVQVHLRGPLISVKSFW
jgi:hypothetical protein